MNKPLGQALQILILGVAILLVAAVVAYLVPIAVGRPSDNARPDYGGLATLVCLFGALGGVGNNFRRFQRLQLHNWEELDSTTRWLMTLQIYLSPIVGALFAVVLYIVFQSGITSAIFDSALFPKFDMSGEYKGLYDYATDTPPETNQDVAKLIFWSFVAGFAEGFVPNFIDKVAKEAEADQRPQG